VNDQEWTPGVPPFPEVLTRDLDPPRRLWARGDAAALDARRVAIIGTRRCTAYGRNFARRLGAELTDAGIGVVSGLAIGIDGAAHEGVLDAGGRPIGVVATGLDEIYPRRHASLWHRVGRSGLLLTEAKPGTAPHQHLFPKRNRIIAALAEIVIVVESSAKGGSMHTVNAAIERGIDVMAVPGPVGSVASEGSNRLLVEGVSPVISADEVVLALGLQTAPRLIEVPAERRPRLSRTARHVLDVLDFVAMPTDKVIDAAGLSRGEVLVALQELAASGRASGGGGWWTRVP
jgi:DNA processing protein